MKFPTGLPDDAVLRNWMDQSSLKPSESIQAEQRYAGSSPMMWKQTSSTEANNNFPPHVVTLNLRPFRTTNLPLDTFMASHCPRRNCGTKPKFMLKPLDEATTPPCVQSSFESNSSVSFSTVQNRLLQEREQPVRPCSNCCQSREVSAKVVTLGDYATAVTKRFQGMVQQNGSICSFRNNSFRPSTKLSQATGQKIQMGQTFDFNCKSGCFNLLQQADIVAKGTPVLTQKNDDQIKPNLSRWKPRSEQVNEKVFKYMDPMLGASSIFQERLSEITQHELDTIKWEKAKKGRKKTVSSS